MSSHPIRKLPGKAGALLSALLVAVAVAAAYRAAPSLGFVDYDDPLTVLAPALKDGLTPEAFRFAFTGTSANLWLPLTTLSHALDIEIYGDWAGGHHLTNVLVHLASSLLLLAWLRRHTGEGLASLAVVLLFAVHPLRVESVAWVTERKDVLSLFFYLLTIWFYSAWAISAGPARRRLLACAIFAGALGVLSKPSLMTLPAVLLLVDVWPLGRLGWDDRRNIALLRERLLEKLPFAALALVAALVAWSTWSGGQFIGEAKDFPLPLRVGYASLAYIDYLARTFVPSGLVVFQSYPAAAGWVAVAMPLAFLLLFAATAAALRAHRRAPWLAVGWLWFLGTILPGSGLVTISDHFAPDRYTYLAHIGLFAAIVWEVSHRTRGSRAGSAAACLVLGGILAALCLLTDRQTRVWQDSESLWKHALEAKGPNYVAHNQLGLALMAQNRHEEAEAELRRAIAAKPEFPFSKGNLARALAARGEYLEAARLLRDAGSGMFWQDAMRRDLLKASLAAGETEAAAEVWRAIAEAKSDDAATRSAAADFLYSAGQEEEAFDHYLAAARLDPSGSAAPRNLGALLLKRGETAEALPWLERSLSVSRSPAETARTRRTLAQAQLLQRDWGAALAHYEAGIEAAPDDPLLLNELAQLLLDCPEAERRDETRALELAERLVAAERERSQVNPRFLRTLARAQLATGQTEEARAVAAEGLEKVDEIAAQEPLEAPWTVDELAKLRKWFSGKL